MTVVQAGYSTGGNCDGENTAQVYNTQYPCLSQLTKIQILIENP